MEVKELEALLFEMAEPGVVPENLLIQPRVDDAPAKTPLLAELDGRDPFLLRPAIDRLGSEPQVRRHILNGEDLVVAGATIARHGRRERAVSAAVSKGSRRYCCGGAAGVAAGRWSPASSCFVA